MTKEGIKAYLLRIIYKVLSQKKSQKPCRQHIFNYQYVNYQSISYLFSKPKLTNIAI